MTKRALGYINKYAGRWRTGAVAWGVPVAVAGLILVMLVAAGFQPWSAGLKGPQVRTTSTTPGRGQGAGNGWYFRSGQWRADGRSLLAAVRFLMEPEAPVKASQTVLARAVQSLTGLMHKP